MPGFLDLPLELRNEVYEYLLYEPLDPRPHGVMLIRDKFVKEHLPLRCYRGLLGVCRQIRLEFQEQVRYMSSKQQLLYGLDVVFSHGRPYFSLTWLQFPSLSPVINSMTVNVHLRLREPFSEGEGPTVPHEHELEHLIDYNPGSFARQLFDYIAILLKVLAGLMAQGSSTFSLMYIEALTLNLGWPTQVVPDSVQYLATGQPRRGKVGELEGRRIESKMRNTLRNSAKAFAAFNAKDCELLSPHIQIGSLRFATEGVIWGEGFNLVLADSDFKWLRY